MKKELLIVAISTLVVGCTGTQVKVTPEPSERHFGNSYSSVGVREISSEKTVPAIGNLSEAFSREIQSSGFSKEVYYPLRTSENVDLVLDSQFSTVIDAHTGSTFLKSFFTGFTFFLLEPFIWYDFDYSLTGNVDVINNGKTIKKVSAETAITISTKWLSLSELASLEGKALTQAKKSLFHQLMQKTGGSSENSITVNNTVAKAPSPQEFEKTIPKIASDDELALTNYFDKIPENWPQKIYYETDEFRYWSIPGETVTDQNEATLSSKNKADIILSKEFPDKPLSAINYETTHMEMVKYNGKYRSWRLVRVARVQK